MAEPGPGAAGGYVAFISYSHKDAAMGRWLHRKLEGYRLPKRLVGMDGEHGQVPARLTPIFRDRDELPAAEDLSARVRTALAESRNLIVLCSPSSAASPWVAMEIATFRELHPGRPVFTAIVDGEPDRCFSPALLEGGTEPLAADLRKRGDGRRLGLLKLVAGLAGTGLDNLIQRDAARRMRRVTYVTMTAITGMLAMVLLAAFALDAHSEADRQRAEAEGLVEFMLTDLRSKLKGVGRIDVLRAVNERAISYYATQGEPRNLPDDSLERRARVLHAIGEDSEKIGDLHSAILRFREAHAATAATLSRHPDDAAAIFAHGQSDYWIGRIHELEGHWAEASNQFSRYSEAASRLIAIAPDNPDYMMEMGWGALNIGLVQLRGLKKAEPAQWRFEEALRWFSRAAKTRPEDQIILQELANGYSYLAESFYAREMWHEARAAYLQQHKVMKRLREMDSANLDTQYRLAIAERAVGRLTAKLHDPAGARALLLRARATTRELTMHDPRNAEWLLLKAKVDCDLLGKMSSGESERLLRADVQTAVAALSAQGNPRIAEISLCSSKFRIPEGAASKARMRR